MLINKHVRINSQFRIFLLFLAAHDVHLSLSAYCLIRFLHSFPFALTNDEYHSCSGAIQYLYVVNWRRDMKEHYDCRVISADIFV